MQETVPQWVQEARAALTSEQRQHIMLWVQALRSGEYLQGRNFLTQIDNDGMQRHCCMGVACVIAMREGVELEVKESEIETYRSVLRYDYTTAVLPVAVQKWLGFPAAPAVLRREHAPLPDSQDLVETTVDESVITLNDDLRWDFAQIADAIEATYLQESGDGEAAAAQ